MLMEQENNAVYVEFGHKLKSARQAKKITQGVLADRVGLSRTSVTNIECGRQQVSLIQFLALAKAVGREPAELLPSLPSTGSEALDKNLEKAVKKQKLRTDEATLVMKALLKAMGDKE